MWHFSTLTDLEVFLDSAIGPVGVSFKGQWITLIVSADKWTLMPWEWPYA